jgi:hypothetical protein
MAQDEEEEEESSLFLAHASPMLQPKGEASEGQALASSRTHSTQPLTSSALLHIDKPHAQAFLDDGSGNDKLEGWYLNSGAMHHMTGCVRYFTDLNCIGSFMFVGKTGEHKLLPGVYYIPALRNSIISLSQFDEGSSRVQIDQWVLWIWDRHGRLLAKVNCGRNRLYVLHMEVAQPLYLIAHRDDEAWRWNERFGHLHFEAL